MRRSLLFRIYGILFWVIFAYPEIHGQDKAGQVIFSQADIKILEQVFSDYSAYREAPVNEIMTKVAGFFEDKPYAAHTLEIEPEQLVVNLREFDCTTFAESCLALSRSIKAGRPGFDLFTSELKKIRYRNGEIGDYSSRIHYFSDWIFLGSKKGITRDVSHEIGGIHLSKQVNFMSTHPNEYPQLKAKPLLISDIEEQEQEISVRERYFVPEKSIGDVEHRLLDGDIIGITTNIAGLDISHVGIAVWNKGRVYLMHASSKEGRVILSDVPLESYLLNSKSATGIMVARPL